MIGPCLCGDPYCGSCGSPGAAEFEDFIDSLIEYLEGLDEAECQLFVKAGKAAVEGRTEPESQDDESQDDESPQEHPWPPDDGKCGWGGCEGDLVKEEARRFDGWTEPDQPAHWKCSKCGMTYGCTLLGEPDYFEYQ